MNSVQKLKIHRIEGQKQKIKEDYIATEEPLEIRISYGKLDERRQLSLAITMRTPGNDHDLAKGFLVSEGIIKNHNDILKIAHIETQNTASQNNIIRIDLSPQVDFDVDNLQRHFYLNSSCGICGKTSIEAVESQCEFDLTKSNTFYSKELITSLPHKLLKNQSLFSKTGGLHAAALFNSNGKIMLSREDIGRHNAVDKLIGASLSKNEFPLSNYLILVSGRAGFELVQKSAIAGISTMVAVGAPSSLSVKLAQDLGMTLIGFLRDEQFNIYSGAHRILQ